MNWRWERLPAAARISIDSSGMGSGRCSAFARPRRHRRPTGWPSDSAGFGSPCQITDTTVRQRSSRSRQVLAELTRLLAHGPVYLHCVAGVERSPLVAMAWLIHNRRMSWQAALDYVQQTHPGTSPLPEQLAVLRSLPLLTTTAQNHWPAVA